MPDAIRDRLNTEIGQALATPALRERLSSEALEPMPMTPQEMGKWIEADIARWTAVAKARGIWLED